MTIICESLLFAVVINVIPNTFTDSSDYLCVIFQWPDKKSWKNVQKLVHDLLMFTPLNTNNGTHGPLFTLVTSWLFNQSKRIERILDTFVTIFTYITSDYSLYLSLISIKWLVSQEAVSTLHPDTTKSHSTRISKTLHFCFEKIFNCILQTNMMDLQQCKWSCKWSCNSYQQAIICVDACPSIKFTRLDKRLRCVIEKFL